MNGAIDAGFRGRPVWGLVLLFVIAGQAAIMLERFGSWAAIRDDRPLLQGRHPLHLYHASLGAETFRQRSSTACYDPAFQAGYPKTPVFDGGCRPAELALYCLGRGDDTAHYKLGLLFLAGIVPVAFALAGRGVGISAAGCCAAAALGCAVWWTPAVQSLFDAGDCDLLLAGLCAIVFTSWLSRYNWDAGPLSWLVLAGTAIVGWYAQPVVWLGLLPIVILVYIAAAPKHGPAWHLGLVGVTLAGLAPNMWWLWDWGRFWWLRQPSADDVAPFPTWGAIVRSTSDNLGLLGGGPFEIALVISAIVACAILFLLGKRSASFTLLAAGVLAAFVARLGEVWPPFIAGGVNRAAPMIAAIAVLPVAGLFALWASRAAIGPPLLLAVSLAPLSIALFNPPRLAPLHLGLSDDQRHLVAMLAEKTDSSGRVLLDDIPPGSRPDWNWTALLPTLASRSYLGGLDPDARLEHAHIGLMNHRLCGRPLDAWSDSDLHEFARRANVGWVAVRSHETKARWLRLGAKVVGVGRDGDDVTLLELPRERTFVLVGQAKWEQADRRKVVLTDIVPADAPHPDGGPAPAKVIVLSLHHQPGLKVSPNVVTVERDPDARDPIPMIRLRLTAPLSRVVISWENR